MLITPAVLTLASALAVAGLVRAEAQARSAGKRVCKIVASTAFVLLAWSLGAARSTYGHWLLLALALSWVGDACLLSRRSVWFLAGLGAFLLAHLAFAAAFASAGPQWLGAAWAFGVLVVLGVGILRWLWLSLSARYRVAVAAYVLAIMGMCALAIGLGLATGVWIHAAGALSFAASDLAVARDRFVRPGLVNKVWGLPVYYVAQLLLAWSVVVTGRI